MVGCGSFACCGPERFSRVAGEGLVNRLHRGYVLSRD